MTKLLAVLMLMSATVRAGPYFRVLGRPGSPRQVLEEACFLPAGGLEATMACTSVPLVTHSARDGYLLVPGEDWALVTAGWAVRPGGNPILMLGSGANLSPVIKGGLLYGIEAMSKPESFTSFKRLLAPPDGEAPDITINAGVKWGLDLTGKARGVFMLSVGPAFSF